ncbi:MAG: Maf family nucleotide pyrophosphatase [Pseudomonadota bacterium]
MHQPLILASASATRRDLLINAAVAFETKPARVDEATIKASLVAAGHFPRDIADALAEAKAARIAGQYPDRLVLGSDQVLDSEGQLISKPDTQEDAIAQLTALAGKRHNLHTAAVIFEDARPVWRHVATVAMSMRQLSPHFIEAYVGRNWDSIKYSVGGYKIEEEGVRLFTKIDGSHFAVLGLPLLEILAYLSQKGVIET